MSTDIVPRTSLPEADAAQKSAVGLSRAGGRRPGPRRRCPDVWAPALNTAARSRVGDLPDALDRAVARTDLGHGPHTALVAGGRRCCSGCSPLAAVVGLGWLIVGYAVRALGLPELDNPRSARCRCRRCCCSAACSSGLLLWLLLKPIVNWGARRARRRAEQRLRVAVTEVAREYVVAPVREVLNAYAQAREALTAVRSE